MVDASNIFIVDFKQSHIDEVQSWDITHQNTFQMETSYKVESHMNHDMQFTIRSAVQDLRLPQGCKIIQP